MIDDQRLNQPLNHLRPDCLPEYSEFVFDWDNTLLWTLPGIRRAINTAFIALNQRFDMQLKPITMAGALETSVFGNRIGKAKWGFTDEQDALYLKLFWQTFGDGKSELPFMPGADLFLADLPSYARVGVVSHKEGPLLRAEIAKLGLTRFTDVDTVAYGEASNKPSPEGINLLYARWGRKPGRSGIIFGDSLVDIGAGKGAGLDTGLVLADARTYAGEAPTYWAPDFYDYHAALKRPARLRTLQLDEQAPA